MLETFYSFVQFAWRPTQGLDTREGFALSADGKLYLATIGEALREQTSPFDRGSTVAAAWSPDGAFIAIGSDSAVLRVEHFTSHQDFTAELTSQVCLNISQDLEVATAVAAANDIRHMCTTISRLSDCMCTLNLQKYNILALQDLHM